MLSMILFFIISSIYLSVYFRRKKMAVVNYLYLVTFAVLLIIFPFISKNETIAEIMKVIINAEQYDYISSALKSSNYIFTYYFIVSIITFIQICILLSALEKKIRIKITKFNSIKERKKEHKTLKIFDEKRVSDKLSLNKVFINYCKMMN